MLRSFLLYLSKAPWCRKLVTGWRFARRAAARFIAGDTLEEAIETIKRLNEKGLYGTLDHLGENVTTAEEAVAAADHYLNTLERLHESGVKSCVSVKLSQMGLNLDSDLCLESIRKLVKKAAEGGTFVRIDIEDSPTVDRTWKIFRTLKEEGLTNVGVAVQSYLYRSEADVDQLLKEGAHFRLCKGAYKEPPELAYPRKKDVDASFDRLSEKMIRFSAANGAQEATPDGKVPPVTAVASHDVKRIEHAKEYAAEVGLPKRALEFQMLLGIRSDLQLRLVEEGYPVRLYIPYGDSWYPYFVRRLAERPANLWFFLSNLIKS